jgi:hypothetical protein
MTNTFRVRTQYGLLGHALDWLATRTNVPVDNLANHMMVISDVARAIEKHGSITGTPLESDFDFLNYDFDGVYELISQIWHEDK